jgi:phosphoribosylaminoimidazole-succinocarboxamide synthase
MPPLKGYTSIFDAIKEGYWPVGKQITKQSGLPELEELGYKLFYIGKNADLYFLPGILPSFIGYRTDRTSVFDIPLDLEIEGKGIIQNQTSHECFDFAENLGFKTARIPLPDNIPPEIANRCMAFEMCKPLIIELPDGRKVGTEFIFRNNLTGSVYKDFYSKGLDPYGLNLPPGLKEWTEFEDVLFTPTTKEAKDLPIRHDIVRAAFPAAVKDAESLFKAGCDFALKYDFIIPDGKKELFVNSRGEIVFGDEILTGECCRYITLSNYEKGIYIPEDKQIIRNHAVKYGWK